MERLDINVGKKLVKFARKVVEGYLKGEDVDFPEKKGIFLEKRGVFVSIHTYPDHELRGCIGFPYPIYPLWEAVKKAALAAAFEDPRFEPLDLSELNKVVFEVSVLTPPEKIEFKDPKELPRKIKVGRDGLIVKYKFLSGLLLPQVAVEEKWTEEEFLSYTCYKAGLPLDCWLKMPIEIYRFSAIVFKEKSPNSDEIEIEDYTSH